MSYNKELRIKRRKGKDDLDTPKAVGGRITDGEELAGRQDGGANIIADDKQNVVKAGTVVVDAKMTAALAVSFSHRRYPLASYDPSDTRIGKNKSAFTCRHPYLETSRPSATIQK